MCIVAIFGGKRLETVPVKFSELEKDFLQKIGEKDDRPLGYVVRELTLRGLTAYLSDGKLRADLSELENLAEKVKVGKIAENPDSFVIMNRPVTKLGTGDNMPDGKELKKGKRKVS
jgi:hypothetical protein